MVTTEQLACAWAKQIADAQFGVPSWSVANMQRLLNAAGALDKEFFRALWLEPPEFTSAGVIITRPTELVTEQATYDLRRGAFETEDSIGYGLDGLAAWRWRPHTHPDFGPLDAATVLAATLGLAVLQLAARRTPP